MSDNKSFLYFWERLFNAGRSVPGRSFSNPKFVFSFLVIMSISSSGVWAPAAFDIDLSPDCELKSNTPANTSSSSIDQKKQSVVKSQKVIIDTCTTKTIESYNFFQGFPVFMFNLGLLGGIAFEFFVRQGPNKYDDLDMNQDEIDVHRMSEFAGFFIWVLAFILSFFGLKEPVSTSSLALIGSFLSVSLWICSNFNKAEFSQEEPDASNIEAGTDDSELEGSGLL